MKVLVVGSGGREHAIAWKIAQSTEVSHLIAAPGSEAWSSKIPFECWDCDLTNVSGLEALALKAKKENVELVVVGPDDPLSLGIVDIFEYRGIPTFGPRKEAALLESSKAFAKEVMESARVPTASYVQFNEVSQAKQWLIEADWRKSWVLKADGLALGKGVRVCESLEEAMESIDSLFEIHGKILIEEKLYGEEISLLGVCDGNTVCFFPPARDYKPVFNEQKGPNTGGMGVFAPITELNNESFFNQMKKEVFLPVLSEMKKRGVPYRGVLYAGLMRDPKTGDYGVLEFNARFGDPETQVLLSLMTDDLIPYLKAAINETLDSYPLQIPTQSGYAVIVMGASPGYPGDSKKGLTVSWDPSVALLGSLDAECFASGISKKEEQWVTSGGRVLGGVGVDESLSEAKIKAESHLKAYGFEEMHYRTDIAKESL